MIKIGMVSLIFFAKKSGRVSDKILNVFCILDLLKIRGV